MDRRDNPRRTVLEEIDTKRMRAMLGDKEVRLVYEVCDTCEGRGHYVNPNIDRQGLTAEDFDEDPDLYENYMGGMYDVDCAQCKGRGLTVTVAEDDPSYEEYVKAQQEQDISDYSDRMTRYYENGGEW